MTDFLTNSYFETKITFSSEIISPKKKSLAERFLTAVIIKGTQQYHRFMPVRPLGTLQVFKVLTEEIGCAVSCVKTEDIPEDNVAVVQGEVVMGAYVGCIYEKQIWFGMTEEISDEFDDFLVSFSRLQGKYASYQKWIRCGCLKEALCK